MVRPTKHSHLLSKMNFLWLSALPLRNIYIIQDGVRRRADKISSFVLLYNTKFMKKLKFDVSVIKNKNNTMDCTVHTFAILNKISPLFTQKKRLVNLVGRREHFFRPSSS